MLLAKLYAMPLLKSGLVLVTGNGMGSPGLTRAASRDLHRVQRFIYVRLIYVRFQLGELQHLHHNR